MKNRVVNAGIRITRNCNMNCSYCNIQSIQKPDLSIEQWKVAGNILKRLGIKNLVILGGEPTEYDKLNEFIEYYEKELDIRCSMTTNAYNNKEKILLALNSGLSKLGVSVDNLDIKKSISPLKCKNGLELINQLIEKKYTKVLVDYIVLSKANADSIFDLIKWLSKNNIYAYILPFHHNNEGIYEHRKNNQRFAFITPEDILKYNQVIDKLIAMKKDGYLISNSIEYLSLTKQHIKDLDWKCEGLSELRIDSDGMMVCCCDRLGTVNKKYSIFDLENKQIFDEFIVERNKDSRICKGCLWPSSVESQIVRDNDD